MPPRIPEKDIDAAITVRAHYFDSVVASYPPEAEFSLVAFDGKKFFNKFIDDSILNKVCEEDDIRLLANSIGNFDVDPRVETNLTKALNINNIKTSNFKSMAVFQESAAEIKTKTRIVKVKYSDNFAYVLAESGVIYKIDLDSKKPLMTVSFISYIKSKFAISEFYVHDILDMKTYKSGILVSTIDNGIFYIKRENEIINIISENNVKQMEVFGNKLFCIIPKETNNVLIYDLTSGVKLETFNQLKRLHQIPIRLRKSGNKAFVLGKNFDRNDMNKILHCWELDKAELTFNNIDYRFSPINEDLRLIPKFIETDKEHLYLVCFRKESLVYFKYQILNISKPPEIRTFTLKGLDYGDANSIKVFDEKVLAVFGNRLIEVKERNEIEKVILLKNRTSASIHKYGEKLFFHSGDILFEYQYPTYKAYTNYSLQISKDGPCNNLEIFIKGEFRGLRFALIDESANQFNPAIVLHKENGVFIKILNSSAKEVYLKLVLTDNDKIEGIAIHKNQIYFKGE